MAERAPDSRQRYLLIALMIVPTWAAFGPVGAFHHIVRFGVLGVLFLDAESPGPFAWQLGAYGVRFSASAFTVSLALWSAACVALCWLCLGRPNKAKA